MGKSMICDGRLTVFLSRASSASVLLLLSGALASNAEAQQTFAAPRGTEMVNGYEAARGEALVRFRQPLTGGTRLQLQQLLDLSDDDQVGSAPEWRLLRSRSRSVQNLLTALAPRSDVAEVQPNFIVHADITPNDSRFSELYGLTKIQAPGAWDVSTGSAAQVVAILDTGIDYGHQDLAANVWSAPTAFTVNIAGHVVTCPTGSHGFNVLTFTCDPLDDMWHGTHVAGTIGAIGNDTSGIVGVNWATRIMALKFLDSTGSGTTAGALNAMEFAIQAKKAIGIAGANVRVLSNSYTGGPFQQTMADEIIKAANNDMLFVAAAGNSSSNNDATPVYPASYPLANVISVAASDSNDGIAGFSNYGASSVHLAAPGAGILSTLPGNQFGSASGTSMATPHVAGAAALILSSCTLPTASLKATILDSVDQLAWLNGAVATNGRLNVDRAIRSCAINIPLEGAATASFIGTDSTTQGSWRGVYGSQGYALVGDSTSLPPSAQLAVTGASTYTWSAASTTLRELQRPTGPSRFAATWYAGSTFAFDLNLTDAIPHRVALYVLDWDPAGRAQRIDVLDGVTAAVLDSRPASGFSQGQYLVWTVTGHVQLRVTLTGGLNAVVSALFLDPAQGSAPNTPPSVTLDAPTSGSSYPALASVPLHATASDVDGSISKVEFFAASIATPLATVTVPPYQATWNNVPGGTYTLTAVATDNLGATTTSTAVTITAAGAAPPRVQTSTLHVKLTLVGQMPTHVNPTSPVAAGSQLLLIDQFGSVYRWDGTSHQILTRTDAPAGVAAAGDEAVLNVAANAAGTSVYVMFTSMTLPSGVPHYVSPRAVNSYQVLCRYDFNGTTLSNPRVITALDVNEYGHTGGGLAVLSNGTILFATGDNGDAGEDGRQYAQDPTNHLSKILAIDPVTGAVSVAARGGRNGQRLVVYPAAGDDRIDFADLGGYISEELNSIARATLLAGAASNNFGWGPNLADNKAREGTFYIDANGAVTGFAPKPEPGFLQPVAEFGREGAALFAVSGPVSSTQSFAQISSLFGDLVSGNVYAITGPVGASGQTVYRVNLADSTLQPMTLSDLTGGARPDPRFFNFPDGTAGVLLETTGQFFRLTEY
jgi:subtilisin family serine protease